MPTNKYRKNTMEVENYQWIIKPVGKSLMRNNIIYSFKVSPHILIIKGKISLV